MALLLRVGSLEGSRPSSEYKTSRAAWRIGPHDSDTWLITMVIVSPLSRVVGPLPNGLFMAYKWWLLTTGSNWDDPPSGGK